MTDILLLEQDVLYALFRGLSGGSTLRTIQHTTSKDDQDWLSGFLAALTAADLSPVTVRGYRQDLISFQAWFERVNGPEALVLKLTEFDLMTYRQYLISVERRKPATVNRKLHALRRLCRWAQETGLLATNPAVAVKSVRIAARRQPRGLTEAEIHSLLRAAGESRHGHARRNYALVQVLVQAGLRVGEVASLCRADLTIAARSGSVRVRQGKGRKEREVPLNASARRALRAYLQEREVVEPAAPVFVSERGGALSARSIQNVIALVCRRAHLTRTRVSPHVLRHTFALTYLRHNPGKLVELACLLGHDSLDTTAIYTQPSMEALAEDLERSHMNVYG